MSDILKAALEYEEALEAKAKAISIEDVLKKIKEHTFSCMVAGGYCRDVFHGVAHKDIDIIVYNVYPKDDGEVTLLNMLWMWLNKNTGVVNISAHDANGVEYQGEERIHFVWHLPYHNADIIFYNAKTHMEVLSKFDCNLNQFYLPSTVPDFDGDRPYNPSLQESPVYVGDSPLETLEFLKELSADRASHMLRKHKAFYPEAWEAEAAPVINFKEDEDLDASFDNCW